MSRCTLYVGVREPDAVNHQHVGAIDAQLLEALSARAAMLGNSCLAIKRGLRNVDGNAIAVIVDDLVEPTQHALGVRPEGSGCRPHAKPTVRGTIVGAAQPIELFDDVVELAAPRCIRTRRTRPSPGG